MSEPFAVPPDGGRATWTDGLNLFKATAEDTGGALAVWESLMPRGSSPVLHVHHHEDEAFYVLEGAMTFRVGDEFVDGPAGTFVWGPRGVPHQFRADSPTARLLTWFVPAGGEQMFFHFSRPAEELTLPPPTQEPSHGLRPEELETIARRYQMEVLGPPMRSRSTT
ncbi:cupin domain-containing protein [Actinomycetospora cinnamomea]|uniref:Cupin type-2 domain-containing protein n=1 Tax=Actinomycetospora cinnamomea TaxID=663609 RepID=A0A2U1F0U9_9PSEU|nr:cupin domain-containing protein [Actinomycetospora cinnamomea]PVZ05814.1 hypothetical protein C8D89_11470 [Actinomycetospora cinnamomea]